MYAAFSEAALQTISDALDASAQTDPPVSWSVSESELRASEGYGQGIRIVFHEGRYLCTYHRERSTDVEVLKDEEEAVTKFLRYCGVLIRQR